MDPVSVFNAIYDTKCLKFGQYNLKSGLVAPYYINLRRLPLYPKLMEAVVTQVVERFLTSQALVATTSQLCRQTSAGSAKILPSPAESEADSQLEEEDELIETASEDGDWEKVPNNDFEPIICGVPYGAIPLASAVAYAAQLPYLFERKEAKQYGDQQCLMDDFVASNLNNKATSNQVTNTPPKRQRVILIEDVICSGESILNAVKNLEKQKLKVEFVICIVDREENGVRLLLDKWGIRVLSLYNMSAILRVLEATGRISSDQFNHIRQWMAENQFVTIGLDPTKKSLPIKFADEVSQTTVTTTDLNDDQRI